CRAPEWRPAHPSPTRSARLSASVSHGTRRRARSSSSTKCRCPRPARSSAANCATGRTANHRGMEGSEGTEKKIIVVPAKAGRHLSATREVERWVPAFAGKTPWSFPSSVGCLYEWRYKGGRELDIAQKAE